ncbi:hypothetical protein [Sulfitobacter sp. R18_1]|uniref:hypothetical protein n=1 Tax=Sulfitobacter sp. R18_1 TaxID=2821104 RepID=UPI001ADC3767|nr:hypothetical protein [Sulfitobacter sp. R18_1]MBO9428805.1 hypothetical protein [Sulfitobacter sp. R18_1]
MSDIDKMSALIIEAHAGQVDKAGEPYHLHPAAVARRLQEEHGIDDEDLIIGALGHDLIEDTYLTKQLLLDMGYSQRSVNCILSVTKEDDESRKAYQAKVLANIDGCYVKRADLEENMDLSRLEEVTDRDLRRNENYARFHIKICARIEEYEATLKASLP